MYGRNTFIEVTNRRREPVYVNVAQILTVNIARFKGDDRLYGNITTERGSVITTDTSNEIMKKIEKVI